MCNDVLLVAIIATWILKVIFLPKLYYFIKMIQKEILLSELISVSGINCMYFYYIKQYDGLTVAPSLLAPVFVYVNLEIKVVIFSKLMPNAFYSHLLLLPTLHRTSELGIFRLFANLTVTAQKI